jgi:outer membrane protein OmpA-like peptidoglycan-associated protein
MTFKRSYAFATLSLAALLSACSTMMTTPQTASTGKYLDHDATVANGGVGNYSDGTNMPKTPAVAEAPAPAQPVAVAPAPAVEKTAAAASLETLSRDLFFQSGKASLNAEQKDALKNVAGLMQNHPEWKLVLIGHADPRGNAAFNQKLSYNRANSVKETLAQYGVSQDRMTIKAMGKVSEANPKDAHKLALDRNAEIRLAD